MEIGIGIFVGAVVIFILSGLKVVNQYELGVKFTLGKFSGIMHPGLKIVIPIIQTWRRVDMRIIVTDVPHQDAITKDNVTVKVNAVLYYKVMNAETAVIKVEHYQFAVSQLAQTTMRDVVGSVSLDDLLSNRESISNKIRDLVDKATDPWGIKVESVELKDIELPPDMVRVMAKQAEAEREKRAVIIKAGGEVIAAQNISKAANTLSESAGALHLRTLHTLNDLSSDKSNTVILALPIEVLRAVENMGKKK